MKKINKSIKLVALLIACLAMPSLAGAQVVNNMYFNIDWDINTPFGNSFADKTSGWGAHGEAGYYVVPNFAVGAFISYHTNNKYIDRQTLMLKSNSALTTDQQHSLFQLPFGLLAKYRFTTDGILEPYATVKLGANYSRMSSYLQAWEIYDDTWGFTVSPEIGVSIFPNPSVRYGFHVALYYNYATNKSKVLTYDIDGRNNIGFRLGVSF